MGVGLASTTVADLSLRLRSGQANLSDLPDPSDPSDPYDLIVVGAGSAGCVVAYRLSADPSVRVLLIEAGGPSAGDPAIETPGRWVSLMGSAWDWGYETEPEPALNGRRIPIPRGKAYGGSSAINAMAYIRGHHRDFDAWREAGNPGWGWDEVLPFFRRAEDNSRGASDARGAGGPLAVADGTDPHAGHHAFLEAARSLGFAADPVWEFNGRRQANGAGFLQKNIRNGRRHSTADAYLAPALSRPNLSVMPHTHAARLLFEGTRCVGLEVIREGRRETVRATREVIVCSGAIDTPKLLLLSGVGPADHLRAVGVPVVLDLPGVGAHLQDHMRITVRWRGRTMLPPSSVTACLFTFSDATRRPRAADDDVPDLQFNVGRGSDSPDEALGITITQGRPLSTGEVRLRSADPLAPPVIRGRFFQEEADLESLVSGVLIARELAAAAAFDALRAEALAPVPAVRSRAEVAAFLRGSADTIYHPAGTCRMGPGDDAVVDAQLRVHGLTGLRVADASIMPRLVNTATHAACVMIGEKAAALIASSD
ncbi:MAG: FAD-dependent oxidoreductase [Vicinamibacterales bacterium]|nr:FAD-dependent oxidoreductase [Vicinamibacterales bacterium]